MLGEMEVAHEEEQRSARTTIMSMAKPFKLLPQEVLRWQAQYDGDQERYKFLVFWCVL